MATVIRGILRQRLARHATKITVTNGKRRHWSVPCIVDASTLGTKQGHLEDATNGDIQHTRDHPVAVAGVNAGAAFVPNALAAAHPDTISPLSTLRSARKNVDLMKIWIGPSATKRLVNLGTVSEIR